MISVLSQFFFANNPQKMDARAATDEQICYPDIKGHNVMIFVRRSACTQISTSLWIVERKVNNAPKTVRGIHRVTATRKLSKPMLFCHRFRSALERACEHAGRGCERVGDTCQSQTAPTHLATANEGLQLSAQWRRGNVTMGPHPCRCRKTDLPAKRPTPVPGCVASSQPRGFRTRGRAPSH